MKIVFVFDDLAKANEYITKINAAYNAAIDEAGALKDKLELIKVDLSNAKSDLATALANLKITDDRCSATDLALVKANEIIADLRDQVESSADLQESLEEALKEVAELGTKISILENHRGETDLIFPFQGRTAKLLGNRFIYAGEELNAEQASKNEAFLERMLKVKSEALVFLD